MDKLEMESMQAHLSGFNPLKILRVILPLARKLLKLDARQSAAWDVVEGVIAVATGGDVI